MNSTGLEYRAVARLTEYGQKLARLCRDRNGKDSRRRPSDAEVRPPSPATQPAAEAAAPGVEFEVPDVL